MLQPSTVVAVVEDDPSMRRSIERLLGAHGFAAECFASAREFLDFDASSRAACLVLDIHLDGMSGLELRARLRASGSALPVIFITAMDDLALEREAMKVGCVAYLRKPFAGELLIGAIKKAVADPQSDKR